MMLLLLISFFTPFSLGEKTTLYGTAVVDDMATLKCANPSNFNLHQQSVYFYWQKQTSPEPELLFELKEGERIFNHVHEKHQNRTMKLQPNGDLYLYNVTRTDEGKYKCIISNKTGWHKIIHEASFQLKVTGVTTVIYGTAVVGGMAVLKCANISAINLQQKSVYYYWQKETGPVSELLFELKEGEQNWKHVHEKHQNRTMELQPNGDLYLYNITVADEGKYSCRISDRIQPHPFNHVAYFQLRITGPLCPPFITSSPTHPVTKGDRMTLECLATDCYLKTRGITWRIFNSSGQHEISPSFDSVQDSATKVHNISSKINVTIEENTNITCVVWFQSDVVILMETEIKMIKLHEEHPNHMLYCLFIIPGVLIIMLLVFILAKCDRPCADPSTNTTAAQNSTPRPTQHPGDVPRHEAIHLLKPVEQSSGL